MPDLAQYHPEVVHFVVALLFIGVLLRLLSLTGKLEFAKPAALLLILVGTLASVLAVQSGDDAHGPAERIPGARPLVQEHEEWGTRTRNIFLGVSALELAALFLRRRRQVARPLLFASTAVGMLGLYFVYETAEHGGELVYSYAGGVGVRSGDPQDISRLFLAGLYNQAQEDRRQNRPLQAAKLFEEMAERFPEEPLIQQLAADSIFRDRGDPVSALLKLETIQVPEGDARLSRQISLLKADILIDRGQTEEARSILEALLSQFPGNSGIQNRLEALAR